MNSAGYGQGGPYGQPGGHGQGGPAGDGSGNQWGIPGQQGFGAGGAYGAGNGNSHGFGPVSGAGQPDAHGAGGFGGFGGPAPDPKHGSASKSKTGLIITAVVVVVVLAVGGIVAWWAVGGAENREKSEVAEAANAAAEQLQSSSDLAVWNELMCAEYRGTDEDIEFAKGILGSMADETLDVSDEDFTPQDADDVTFTNDEKTRATVGTGSDEVRMAKEDGEWKICDPNLDLTIFEGGAALADSLNPGNW